MSLIPTLSEYSVTELSTLSGQELRQLQNQVDCFTQQLKYCKERLTDAITLKYSVRALAVRQSKAKESGIIRFNDDGISIVADIAKKPQWDQTKLAEIAERIRAKGEDPTEFLTVNDKVAESKYSAWPTVLREQFSPARTLKFGKQAFLLNDDKEGDA